MSAQTGDFQPISTLPSSYFKENWKTLSERNPEIAKNILTQLDIGISDVDSVFLFIKERLSDSTIQFSDTNNVLALESQDSLVFDSELFHKTHAEMSENRFEACWIFITFSLPGARVALNTHPYSKDLIVVYIEPDLDLFLAQLFLENYSDVLSRANTSCIFGKSWQKDLSELIQHEAYSLIPWEEWLIKSGRYQTPEVLNIEQVIRDYQNEVTQDRQSPLSKIELLKQTPPSQISYQKGARLWMCGISQANQLFSIHFEILNALAEAYREEGFEVSFKHEYPYRESVRLRLQRDLLDAAPDFLLLLNAYPGSFIDWIFQDSEAHNWCQAKRLVWLTDDITYSPGFETGFSENDIVFCVDRTYIEPIRNLGAGQALYLPSAASISRQGQHKPEYEHPIAFVGSVSDLRSELSNLRPESKQWLQQAVSATIGHRAAPPFAVLDSNGQLNLIAVVESICLHMNKPHLKDERALSYALYVLANTYKRITLVKELIPFGIAVYGNQDWEKLLDEKESAAFHGPVAYEDLPDLYASAKISLNIHSLQCPTCLNPRDFDILMAGGFLLSDWVGDADMGLLIDGSEAVFCRSTNDLKELARYYLENEHLRRAISQSGHERVMRDHRYINRVQESMELSAQSI